MTEQQIDRERLSDHDRMNYWWRRATQAEARIKAVEDVLDKHESILGDNLGVPVERIRRALNG